MQLNKHAMVPDLQFFWFEKKIKRIGFLLEYNVHVFCCLQNGSQYLYTYISAVCAVEPSEKLVQYSIAFSL
jgi:hypothetical protein